VTFLKHEEFQMSPLALKVAALALSLYPDDPGIYLEAGANDGVSHSNTYALEMSGWTGILVEPSPVAFRLLAKTRPNNVLIEMALADSDAAGESVTGTFSSGSLTATADPTLFNRDPKKYKFRGLSRLSRWTGRNGHADLESVPATTLDKVLLDSGLKQLDLMILDLEGMELDALRGLGEHRPRIVIIETRMKDALSLSDLLLNMGYVCAGNLSKFNQIDSPIWTGDHQDFGWCQSKDTEAIQELAKL